MYTIFSGDVSMYPYTNLKIAKNSPKKPSNIKVDILWMNFVTKYDVILCLQMTQRYVQKGTSYWKAWLYYSLFLSFTEYFSFSVIFPFLHAKTRFLKPHVKVINFNSGGWIILLARFWQSIFPIRQAPSIIWIIQEQTREKLFICIFFNMSVS